MNKYSKRIKDDKKNTGSKKKNENLFIYKAIMLLIIVSFFFTMYTQERDLITLNDSYNNIQAELKEKESELKKVKKELKSVNDDKFIEKIAREKLKMVKPNEKIYIDTNKKINLKESENN